MVHVVLLENEISIFNYKRVFTWLVDLLSLSRKSFLPGWMVYDAESERRGATDVGSGADVPDRGPEVDTSVKRPIKRISQLDELDLFNTKLNKSYLLG